MIHVLRGADERFRRSSSPSAARWPGKPRGPLGGVRVPLEAFLLTAARAAP